MSSLVARAKSGPIVLVYPIQFGADGIFGGGERYALELARALSKHRPTRLVTFGKNAGRHCEGELEIAVHEPRRLLRGEPMNPLSIRFLRDLLDADVIHCTAWNTLVTDLATTFGRLTGKPVFVTDVGGGASLTLGNRLPLLEWVRRFLLIAPQGGAQFLAHRERWRIIYAGIDVERYRPPENPKRRGVLYVGRLLPHKGIDTLISAVDASTPLTLVGRPYHPDYHRHLQELGQGKQVRFITAANDEEILAYYQTAAISVLPSVYRSMYGQVSALPELLGFTAMEAMACGAAVICSRVGGLPELMIDNETGLLVEPGNVAQLRDAIHRLLTEPEVAARFGAAARQRIETVFTWDQVARRCLRAYEE